LIGNAERLRTGAMNLVRGATHILRGLCVTEDEATVKLLEHQATLWTFRLIAVHGGEPENARGEIDALRIFAEHHIDSLAVQIETRREEAHYALLMRDLDRATELIEEEKVLASSPLFSTTSTQLPLLRVEIELLLETRKRLRAREAIQEYIHVWKGNPDVYHFHVLRRMLERYDVKSVLPWGSQPVYLTPAIPHLYLEPKLLRL